MISTGWDDPIEYIVVCCGRFCDILLIFIFIFFYFREPRFLRFILFFCIFTKITIFVYIEITILFLCIAFGQAKLAFIIVNRPLGFLLITKTTVSQKSKLNCLNKTLH